MGTSSDIAAVMEEHPTWDLLSKEKLYKRLKSGHGVSKRDFDAWWSKQKNPVHEVFAKPSGKRFAFAKIARPPYSFQIDVVFMNQYKRQNGGKDCFLLLVDICSRKAFAYVLKDQTMPTIVSSYKRFLKDAGNEPFMVQGDNAFNAKEFQDFNTKRNIPVLTGVAADEHVTVGDPLGVLDRLVQTLRTLIEKRIHARDDPKWTTWLAEVIHDYNTNPHETLKNRTPDELYADEPAMRQRWVDDSAYNATVQKPVQEAFRAGDYVRVRLKKGTFEKGQTQSMSLEVYEVSGVRGSRVSLLTYPGKEPVARAFKPNELLKVDTPRNLEAPKAATKAKKQAKQGRRLRAEGLPELPAEPKPKGDTIADHAAVGQLAIVDVEGASDEPQRLEVRQGGKVGYVYAGVVTKKTAKRVYLKLYEASGPSRALSQKKLILGSKSYNLVGRTHKDALLYTSDPPRVRSDGSSSLGKAVVDAVTREYVFS